MAGRAAGAGAGRRASPAAGPARLGAVLQHSPAVLLQAARCSCRAHCGAAQLRLQTELGRSSTVDGETVQRSAELHTDTDGGRTAGGLQSPAGAALQLRDTLQATNTSLSSVRGVTARVSH